MDFSQFPHRNLFRGLIVAAILIIVFLLLVNQPSTNFSLGSSVEIKSGETLTAISHDLKDRHIIHSTLFLKALIIFLDAEKNISAGDYYFPRPITTFEVAKRLIEGDFETNQVRVTIPEGLTIKQISEILSRKLPHFSSSEFLKNEPAQEGYFFPDTYFFALDATTSEVVNVFRENFKAKMETVRPQIDAFGKSEKEILTMASILEEEARTTKDWQIISGILWKRIRIGMPLQVDSSLNFVLDKTGSELTSADLKMKSPYNTYVNKGLPPTPISNPGLKTITAAANPIATSYLYYLSDRNGDIHYAATFAEHVKNKQQYLK